MAARRWMGILVLNAALALAFRAMVPAQPLLSDRDSYDWVGEHGLAPGCPMSVYCYRVLVPSLLESIPLPPETRWRAYEFLANTLAGFVLALAVARVTPGLRGPLLATWLAQTSFALTYTAYDPFTADPMVFLIAALTLLAWLADWPMLVLGLGVAGVFAKETVALVVSAAAMAAWIRSREDPVETVGPRGRRVVDDPADVPLGDGHLRRLGIQGEPRDAAHRRVLAGDLADAPR